MRVRARAAAVVRERLLRDGECEGLGQRSLALRRSVCVCMYVCVCVCVYVCMYVSVCVCVCVSVMVSD
jgi:hypothetical protein